MERTIAIVNGEQVTDVTIKPGTTAGDVLKSLNLSGFWLSPRDGAPFGEHDELFGKVSQGAKLFASPAASVAR